MKRVNTSELLRMAATMAILALVGFASGALAQSYPQRPVRIVVPYAPGGSSDMVARLVAQKLSDRFGSPFLVENKSGAGGRIGYDLAAKSAADGYTLASADSSFAMLPALYPKLSYDSDQLQPLIAIAEVPLVLVASRRSGLRTIGELVKHAKENPGKLNFGSGGTGSATHLAGELLKHTAGINIVHVPFKGAADAMSALLAGSVDVLVTAAPTAAAHIKAGSVNGLAVTSHRRARALPEIPTSTEAGFAGFSIVGWLGLAIPKGAPPSIVSRLRAEATTALAQPDMVQRLTEMGAEPLAISVQEFASLISSDTARWRKIVSAARIEVE